ncbi:hypothetical protein JCM19992_13650 [Thermostilla marina]
MGRNRSLLNGFVGLTATSLVRLWMGTLDYRVYYYDRSIDPVFEECTTAKLYLFWHEYILFPLYLRGHCHLTMLLSRHRDADILSYVAGMMGFRFVRGSSNRGGTAALRQLMQEQGQHLTITPDGPRGPRRQLAAGPIYLASRLGMPLVLMGFGYDRPWRLPTWDRFAIPRPFSRARAVVGPPILIPPSLDRRQIESQRRRIETLLSRLTTAAENWAVGGRLPGSLPLFRGHAAVRPAPPESQRAADVSVESATARRRFRVVRDDPLFADHDPLRPASFPRRADMKGEAG